MEEARAHMASLMRQRDLIESSILNSIKEHEGLGIGLKDPLLDSQGFPRAELDLYQIRSLRNSIARQQNDLKIVMKQIEELLPKVIPAGTAGLQPPSTGKPFAVISVVPTGSFAFKAGFCCGDLILKFGSLRSLNALYELRDEFFKIRDSNAPLKVELLRDGSMKVFELDIQNATGLGCEVKLLQ